MLLEAMTWKNAEEFLDTNPIALVPLGSVEQHGSLGPLGAGTIRIVRDVTSTGGFGADDPAHANAEWGNAMFEAVITYLNAFIQEFKTVTCINE